jgi:hypothetical protein
VGARPGRDAAGADGSLNDHQVALIYSLVLLVKTGSAADRPGEPRYSDVRDRGLESIAEELEEVRARGWRTCGAEARGRAAPRRRLIAYTVHTARS